jgi:hypothetical protein
VSTDWLACAGRGLRRSLMGAFGARRTLTPRSLARSAPSQTVARARERSGLTNTGQFGRRGAPLGNDRGTPRAPGNDGRAPGAPGNDGRAHNDTSGTQHPAADPRRCCSHFSFCPSSLRRARPPARPPGTIRRHYPPALSGVPSRSLRAWASISKRRSSPGTIRRSAMPPMPGMATTSSPSSCRTVPSPSGFRSKWASP